MDIKTVLKEVLVAHEKWVQSEGREGKRAELRNALLQEADLHNANLQEADLEGARLSVADLMAVSDAGEIMPPKSTWFEPKLRDGLLSHVI